MTSVLAAPTARPRESGLGPRPAGARHRVVRAAGYLLLTALSVATAYPFVWMLVTSLRETNTVFSGGFLPDAITFGAYERVVTNVDLPRHFLISVLITAVTVVAVVFLATLAGYAFAWLAFPAKKAIYVMLLGTLLVPATALIVPQFLELKQLRLLDTTAGLILVYVGTNLPFAMLLMRAYFETLPAELIDSARVDGAGEFRIFWSIMLPLAGPGVATLTIFQFMFTWNEFILANTLIQTPENLPLQPVLFALKGLHSTDWPLLTAALFISVIPVVVVYMRLQGRYVQGLTAGALRA